MRRRPALRSLGTEHHAGSVIARRARQSVREGSHIQWAAWDEVKAQFRAELEGHFRREELGLLPTMRALGENGLVERTLREHRTLRVLVAEDRADNLEAFADLLASHIRFEERTLFDTAQRLLGQSRLHALQAMSEAEGPAAR
jgi:hemerythrin-like domain-containing protein